MQPHTAYTQFFTQFERSPEPFPKTIVFPEAWDLSEILNGPITSEPAVEPEPISGKINDSTADPV